MAGLTTRIETVPERRPAILVSGDRRTDWNGRVTVTAREERVLIWTHASREAAFCEHEDGTTTLEDWNNVRFLDSKDMFKEVFWDDPYKG